MGNPKAALVRRVRHLRLHSADASTPIFLFYDERRRARKITDRVLTDQLRVTAQSLGLDVETTVGALRCTGATAALEGEVPVDVIKLIGRWRSDEVFRYLHTQSEKLMSPIAQQML